MEIQIDTSAISYNSQNTNLQKIEDSVSSEIDNFINNTNDVSDNFKENFQIRIHYFLIENPDDRMLTIYGTIIDNNQTFYEYNINDPIFLLIRNSLVINKFISNFLKLKTNKEFIMRFEIEDALIFKYKLSDNSENLHSNENTSIKNKIYLVLIFISSIIKVYFGLWKKFKYNKWDNIIINSKWYEESVLISNILTSIGYEVYIHTSYLNLSAKTYTKEDFSITQSSIDKLELLSDFNINNCLIDNKEQKNIWFTYIFDLSGDTLSSTNKINTLNIMKFDGRLIIFHDHTPSNNQVHSQLDPRDLYLLFNKNISINFVNVNNSLKYNETIGRQINFINELMDRIIAENTQIINNVKSLLKKLQCKVIDLNENSKEIDMEDFESKTNYLCLYVIG